LDQEKLLLGRDDRARKNLNDLRRSADAGGGKHPSGGQRATKISPSTIASAQTNSPDIEWMLGTVGTAEEALLSLGADADVVR